MVELWMLFVFPLAAIAYFNLLMSHACVLVGASGETQRKRRKHSCLLALDGEPRDPSKCNWEVPRCTGSKGGAAG